MSKLTNITAAGLSSNPRASATAWLRYSHIVEAAIKVHPNVYTYTPADMSSYSVASKLRDAVRGAIAFGHSNIAPEVLSKWWSEVVVTNLGDTVRIGPRERKSAPVKGHSDSEAAFTFRTLAPPEIDAFELLLSNGRIKGPVLIITPPVNLISASLHPNVERIFKPDGKLVLL